MDAASVYPPISNSHTTRKTGKGLKQLLNDIAVMLHAFGDVNSNIGGHHGSELILNKNHEPSSDTKNIISGFEDCDNHKMFPGAENKLSRNFSSTNQLDVEFNHAYNGLQCDWVTSDRIHRRCTSTSIYDILHYDGTHSKHEIHSDRDLGIPALSHGRSSSLCCLADGEFQFQNSSLPKDTNNLRKRVLLQNTVVNIKIPPASKASVAGNFKDTKPCVALVHKKGKAKCSERRKGACNVTIEFVNSDSKPRCTKSNGIKGQKFHPSLTLCGLCDGIFTAELQVDLEKRHIHISVHQYNLEVRINSGSDTSESCDNFQYGYVDIPMYVDPESLEFHTDPERQVIHVKGNVKGFSRTKKCCALRDVNNKKNILRRLSSKSTSDFHDRTCTKRKSSCSESDDK